MMGLAEIEAAIEEICRSKRAQATLMRVRAALAAISG
jgi:hypothetical protein